MALVRRVVGFVAAVVVLILVFGGGWVTGRFGIGDAGGRSGVADASWNVSSPSACAT